MARPDGRIEAGQPLRGAISARAWNRAQDAADLVLGAGTGIEAGVGSMGNKPYTSVLCKSSVTVARWGILAITGLAITPTSTASAAETKSFEEQPIVTGGTPSATTTAWCVAVEPIESGKIGRVAVGGVVQCKVEVLSTMHPYVKCGGQSNGLRTAWDGQASVLFKETVGYGNVGWALIDLGHNHSRVLLKGYFDAPWPKHEARTVRVGDGVTYSVDNPFGSITGTGERSCVIAYVNSEESTYFWYLIAAECS